MLIRLRAKCVASLVRWIAASLACVSCSDGAQRSAVENDPASAEPAASTALASASQGDDVASLGGARASSGFFHADWCDGPGQEPLQLFNQMRSIAVSYDQARSDDCRTAGLMAPLSHTLSISWWDYLLGYSIVLAGCLPLSDPVEGGIRVFGPAHTGAIGLSHPALGREDVGLLISHYLDSFVPALELTDAERSIVEGQLWATAEPELEAGVSGDLSTCPPVHP